MVKQATDDLGRRLSALRTDFAALGIRAAEAASALTARLPPPPALVDDLGAAREAFDALRSAMMEQAGALALVLDAERLDTLRDLEPVLGAIAAAERRQALVEAWEEAREGALVVLDRVMALIHRDDPAFAALADCQVRARELHGALADSVPDDLEHETKMVSGKVRPFSELIALVEGWHALDDDRCAFLQDAIAESFGRPLALAALRGKLGREGEVPPAAPEPRARGFAGAPPGDATYPPVAYPPPGYAYPAAPVAPASAYAPGAPSAAGPGVPGAPGVVMPDAGAAPTGGFAGGGAAGIVVSGAGTAGAPGTPGGSAVAGGGNSVVVEIRLSGDKVSVETPEARREREQLLERLARENAQWWIAARDGWTAMRERGATFAEAAQAYIARFPYLLSVPLQKSAEPEGGGVAEGYALLLAHIETMEAGFVREALTRLNPQFTTREKDQSYPLGQELYLYVVAEGRLYKTYPEFVKEVLVSALPGPGPWVQGGLVESDAETRLFVRPATLGSTQEQTRSVTGWKERGGPHVFTLSAGPLTTRFFTLQLAGQTLGDPPDVEIKLRENDAPTDHAWLVTLPMPGSVQPLAPRKHRTGGTTLSGLGRDFSGLWIGIFNADPSNDRTYELSIVLRRKPPEAPKPGTKPQAPPVASPSKFFGRKR